jgi:hypothetical protein
MQTIRRVFRRSNHSSTNAGLGERQLDDGYTQIPNHLLTREDPPHYEDATQITDDNFFDDVVRKTIRSKEIVFSKDIDQIKNILLETEPLTQSTNQKLIIFDKRTDIYSSRYCLDEQLKNDVWRTWGITFVDEYKDEYVDLYKFISENQQAIDNAPDLKGITVKAVQMKFYVEKKVYVEKYQIRQLESSVEEKMIKCIVIEYNVYESDLLWKICTGSPIEKMSSSIQDALVVKRSEKIKKLYSDDVSKLKELIKQTVEKGFNECGLYPSTNIEFFMKMIKNDRVFEKFTIKRVGNDVVISWP